MYHQPPNIYIYNLQIIRHKVRAIIQEKALFIHSVQSHWSPGTVSCCDHLAVGVGKKGQTKKPNLVLKPVPKKTHFGHRIRVGEINMPWPQN